MCVLFKNSFRTTTQTRCVSIQWLMQFMEITVACSEIHMKHTQNL